MHSWRQVEVDAISSPQASDPPAVEVAKEGEVSGQHVTGVFRHNVLIDSACGVHIVVRRVAEGLNVGPLPEDFVVSTIIWIRNLSSSHSPI